MKWSTAYKHLRSLSVRDVMWSVYAKAFEQTGCTVTNYGIRVAVEANSLNQVHMPGPCQEPTSQFVFNAVSWRFFSYIL